MKQFNLDEYLKNPNLKVTTRDGKSVRIVCTDWNNSYTKPIIALILMPNGDEIINTYWEDGRGTHDCEEALFDLFFAPEPKLNG